MIVLMASGGIALVLLVARKVARAPRPVMAQPAMSPQPMAPQPMGQPMAYATVAPDERRTDEIPVVQGAGRF